ncbi:L-allo-threonine aldolase [Venustampulla echinocandica]|uniref:L-allo-threonine aldolase n=1 Tax=Venustampulla echinocandica TaxID=2656787 RepID=A0A370TE92_9HELO|nr:L-allo-threonine aldolase [Venustampulla echinocandica]RDL32998.1 L-allo-threonine aldolase [Venustampulla echinocandica]
MDEACNLLGSMPIAWANPGQAQFDFRTLPGDVVTTPTISMLRAIIETSLLDDVYQEDPTTTSLERLMANMTGHSQAAFVLSGTMGNQVALRTHLTQSPHAVLCDSRSHIIHWEAGGLASLCGAMVQGVSPANGAFLTLEDIQRKAILSDDVHRCPTRVISLENTISGLIHPLSEIQRISEWARRHKVKLHLDGARLWEAVAAGGGTLLDYAKCFDSVSLDFSKGLGAPMGAIIVGDSEFIARARRIRKSIGGGMRQAGVLSAAARDAVEGFHDEYEPGEKLRFAHALARSVAEMWIRKGGKLSRPSQTNLVWVDLNDAAVSSEEFQDIGRKYGVKVDGSRIVLHYQISDEGIRRLGSTFTEVLSKLPR